jgi:hypothetical protein
MHNFGKSKLVGALALAVAAVGIGTAVQTGTTAHATVIARDHDYVTERTRTVNWIRFDGTKVSSYTFSAYDDDVVNFDKVELPKGYRIALALDMDNAHISAIPDPNYYGSWLPSSSTSVTAYVIPTTKAVKADYKIPYTGVVKTKKATNVYTFGSNYTLKKGKSLKKSSSWKTSYLLSVKGALYYGVGGGQWVKASDVAIQKIGVGHVNYNKHYGIQIWNAKHGIIYDKYGHARKLKGQTNWKVFGTATIKGKKYYNLGINQFMEAKYVSLHK